MNQDDLPRRYVVWDNQNELPLITVQSKSTGKFFGLFLLTAGPAEILTFPQLNRLVYRLLGANVLTLYLYAGPTFREVVNQHYETLGRSKLPAYSSLGFHIVDSEAKPIELEKAVTNMKQRGIPVDNVWMKTQQLSTPLTVDDDYAKQIDRVARDTLKNTLGVRFGASVLPGLNIGSGNAEDEYVLSAGKAVHAI